MIDGTLICVSVARTLSSDGDVPDAVEIPAKTELVNEVVCQLFILDSHAKSLKTNSNEPGLGEIHQSSGRAGSTGATVNQTYVNLKEEEEKIHLLKLCYTQGDNIHTFPSSNGSSCE